MVTMKETYCVDKYIVNMHIFNMLLYNLLKDMGCVINRRIISPRTMVRVNGEIPQNSSCIISYRRYLKAKQKV